MAGQFQAQFESAGRRWANWAPGRESSLQSCLFPVADYCRLPPPIPSVPRWESLREWACTSDWSRKQRPKLNLRPTSPSERWCRSFVRNRLSHSCWWSHLGGDFRSVHFTEACPWVGLEFLAIIGIRLPRGSEATSSCVSSPTELGVAELLRVGVVENQLRKFLGRVMEDFWRCANELVARV